MGATSDGRPVSKAAPVRCSFEAPTSLVKGGRVSPPLLSGEAPGASSYGQL